MIMMLSENGFIGTDTLTSEVAEIYGPLLETQIKEFDTVIDEMKSGIKKVNMNRCLHPRAKLNQTNSIRQTAFENINTLAEASRRKIDLNMGESLQDQNRAKSALPAFEHNQQQAQKIIGAPKQEAVIFQK